MFLKFHPHICLSGNPTSTLIDSMRALNVAQQIENDDCHTCIEIMTAFINSALGGPDSIEATLRI